MRRFHINCLYVWSKYTLFLNFWCDMMWLAVIWIIPQNVSFWGLPGDHCGFSSFCTVFTMKCTAIANPITLKKLFMFLDLVTVVCVENLIYHFKNVQFWINSHFVAAFSSLSLLTLMLTLISKFFVACLNKMLQIFISQTPSPLQLLLKQKLCSLKPWIGEFGFQ